MLKITTKKTDTLLYRFFNILIKNYFFAKAALISIEIEERSIFNFPDIVSITTVVSASSDTFP